MTKGPAEPTTPAAADGEVVPPREVRARADALGLTPRLRRLSAEGLLAWPDGVGRGRGRGRTYGYPLRALDQLTAVAEALPYGHRYAAVRHRIWWSVGGRLERAQLWGRDRMLELAIQVAAWDMPPALDGDLPDERERHIVDTAHGLRTSRLPGRPRKRLGTVGDGETYVRLFTSVLGRDDLLDPALHRAGASLKERLEAVAAMPLNTDDEGRPVGSLGALFARVVGWRGPALPDVDPRVAALAAAHYIPTPRLAVQVLTAMSEERAAHLRDAVISWATVRGQAEMFRSQPILAVQAMVMFETVARADPRVLEVPTPAV